MNEEQLKWLESVKAICEAAMTADTVDAYIKAFNDISDKIEESP